jgi:hypothetical protein
VHREEEQKLNRKYTGNRNSNLNRIQMGEGYHFRHGDNPSKNHKLSLWTKINRVSKVTIRIKIQNRERIHKLETEFTLISNQNGKITTAKLKAHTSIKMKSLLRFFEFQLIPTMWRSPSPSKSVPASLHFHPVLLLIDILLHTL